MHKLQYVTEIEAEILLKNANKKARDLIDGQIFKKRQEIVAIQEWAGK